MQVVALINALQLKLAKVRHIGHRAGKISNANTNLQIKSAILNGFYDTEVIFKAKGSTIANTVVGTLIAR